MDIPAGRGVLVVQMDVEPDWEDEFNRWYNEEHLPDVVALPGFISGRRFKAVEGHPTYLAIYEVESPDVLFSEPYLDICAHRSPWTLRVLEHIKMNKIKMEQVFPSQGAYTRKQPVTHSHAGGPSA